MYTKKGIINISTRKTSLRHFPISKNCHGSSFIFPHNKSKCCFSLYFEFILPHQLSRSSNYITICIMVWYIWYDQRRIRMYVYDKAFAYFLLFSIFDYVQSPLAFSFVFNSTVCPFVIISRVEQTQI